MCPSRESLRVGVVFSCGKDTLSRVGVDRFNTSSLLRIEDLGDLSLRDAGVGDSRELGVGDFGDFGVGEFRGLRVGDFGDFGVGEFRDLRVGDFGDFGDFGDGDSRDLPIDDFGDFCLDWDLRVDDLGDSAVGELRNCGVEKFALVEKDVVRCTFTVDPDVSSAENPSASFSGMGRLGSRLLSDRSTLSPVAFAADDPQPMFALPLDYSGSNP
eukprot:Hpha_TRINITY_DN12602_c0_g1::TRINITY_DN12602_c0_g1_i1::g.49673::m.49673